MAIRIVRLGTPRSDGEGPRLGTVRRPPRGVRREDLARGDWYDVWFPNLAPSAELVAQALDARTDAQWRAFAKRFRAEMAEPGPRRDLDVLATLSRVADFSVGCYCEHASRCHRSVLRTLLSERGAALAD